MKKASPKKQQSQMRGLLMILFIAVLALAAVFVSQRLSSQQSVSPNAPESKPMAFVCNAQTVGVCGVSGGCKAGYQCTQKSQYNYDCVRNSKCSTNTPTPATVCNAFSVGNCGPAGGCKAANSRCKQLSQYNYSCQTDTTCVEGGGGGTPIGDCSRSSASKCQGLDQGDSCGGGNVCTTSGKGTDGKAKCSCGTQFKPECPESMGYVSNGKCEWPNNLRPITLENCCIKK